MAEPNGYKWTGHLQKGEDPDSIIGILFDRFGFSIEITGKKVAGKYEIVGIPGPVPEEFRMPGLDYE